MAQIKIKKYNTGGTLYTETGDAYTLEQVEQMVRENPTNKNLKDIADELRAGRDVTHSISDNWSSVTSDDFTAGQKRRAEKEPNSLARRLGATFNTKVHQYGEDVNETTNILAAAGRKNAATATTASTPANSENSSNEYVLISAGDGTPFVYDSETGQYVEGDFTNARLMSLLRNLDGYLAGSEDGTSYKFKGLSSDIRQVLKDMYATNPNFIKELQQKIRSGKIIAGSPEASILLNLGIGSNVTKDELAVAEKEKALKQYFIDKGFNEDQFKDFLQYVELDGQGLKLKSGVEGPWEAGNYYFNEDYNGDFRDLVKGKILYNNRFYDANQLAESGMISDWVKALKEHRFGDADAIIKWDWTGDQVDNYDYQFLSDNLYNEFLDGKRYLDVTGQYEKTYDDQGNVYQIMGYYDPNDANIYTKLGFVDPSKIKYARFDSMGNLIDENYNTALLRKSINPWSHTATFQERRDDGQVVIPTITTRNGRGILGMDVTYDPDKGNVRFSGAAVQQVLGKDNGDTIELDGEIAKILSPEFFDNLEQADRNDLKKFQDTILSLVGNKMGNIWTRNQLSRREWRDLLRPTYGADADRYANIIYNYFKTYIGRTGWFNKMMQQGIVPGVSLPIGYGLLSPTGQLSREARLHEFTPKHQQGGLFTGSATPAASAPKIIQSDRYVPATTEEAGAFQFGEFTDADWLELAGLGADLSSVVTGLAGFTPASVATGLAGTGATFLADIKRDGFQAKDLGNLGLGLLFDAASIVPGLGTAASTGQVVRTIKKGLPVLMKLAGIAGIGSSLSLAVNKIQSGEKLTMKDLRIIMNGVLGAYTMAKQGIDVTNSRKNRGKEIDIDLQKMHMDEIDASNLSDGQKAAMKHWYDGGDYSGGLTGDQATIYSKFIADGGDELALKMLIGDDSTFKTLRSQQELLTKVKNGETLNESQIKEYETLMKDLEISRLGMSKADVERYQDMSTDNARVKELLLKEASGTPLTANEQVELNGFKAMDEYQDFFSKYNALPKEGRHRIIERELITATDDYNGSMFKKKNAHFTKDESWAADVKNKERFADDALVEYNTRLAAQKQAQADYDDAVNEFNGLKGKSRTRAPEEISLEKKINTKKSKKSGLSTNKTNFENDKVDLETKLTTLETERDNFWNSLSKKDKNDPLNKAKLKDYNDDITKIKGDITSKQNQIDSINKQIDALDNELVKLETDYNTIVADNNNIHKDFVKEIKKRLKASKNALTRANNDVDDIETMLGSDRSFERDATGAFRKSSTLTQEIGDVATHFDPSGGKTKTELRKELDTLLGITETNPTPTRSMDGLDASHLQDLDQQRNLLFDELSKTKRKLIDVETTEYATLKSSEKAEVNKILNKNVDDVTEEDIQILNYYTSKARGTVTSDLNAATIKTAENAKLTEDFTKFKLKEDIGLEDVMFLLKRSGLPNANQLKISEVEWAKIKKAEDPGLALKEFLKNKKGISEEFAEKIMRSVTTEVDKPEKTWRGKKKAKEGESNDTVKKVRQLDQDWFKTLHKADNSLWGKILGRSGSQEAYKKALYGIETPATRGKVGEVPWRYYQPMLHGMHYGMFREPVHVTPWYEPNVIYDEEE